ncbi:acyl-CoA N-acyltransferase [Myxococcus phage Mx8]|uniref:p53 n=1 Tax=Myxococcus phage Mx8 TaxID=49964 RepID=Q94MR6_9CAUD|nr:acyl-CoA N-acyltransferase [Myxococcus phage Mx8]AAK94388.1 p53 [Myxococcus phage Mx8]
MRVEAGHTAARAWIEALTGCVLTRNARAIQAVDASGRIRGVVAYDCWTENAVQAHMAVDTPVVWRSLLRPAFRYPFLEAGKGVLLGIIPADNARSCALALRFGFRETHRVRDGWTAGIDLVVHELRREECRWLKE